MSIALRIAKIIPHDQDTETIKYFTDHVYEEAALEYYFGKTEYKFYDMVSNYVKWIRKFDKRKYRRIKRNFNRFSKSVENINPNLDYSVDIEYIQMHDLNNKFKYKRKCQFVICFSKKSMLDFLNKYKYYYHDKRDKTIHYEKFYDDSLGYFICPVSRYHDFLKAYQQLESIEWKPGYFFICSY